MSACATSSPDGTKWQGAGPNASPVTWSMGNAGSCASNACHSTHRCVPCDENQSETRMPEIGTSGSMSGDGKRGVAEWPKLPRPSSTLPKRHLVRRKDMSEVEVKADSKSEC